MGDEGEDKKESKKWEKSVAWAERENWEQGGLDEKDDEDWQTVGGMLRW